MRFLLISLLVFEALISISCRQNVESSSISPEKKVEEPLKPKPEPNKLNEKLLDDEVQNIGRFSNFPEDESRTLIKFQDYQIKKDVVRKSDDIGSPLTGIIDAVLLKKGKRLGRFEGVYYPLGNEMSFGLYSFLGGTEKQLLVYDETLHYEHDWIIRLSPKFEVIFNNEDFEIYNGFWVLDIDNDGIMELIAGKSANLSFIISGSAELAVKTIFKYDSKSHKYLPATSIYPEYVLNGFESEGFDEQLKNFRAREKKGFSEFLQIFMKYIYAGKESEAWKFFDENFSVENLEFGFEENKVKTREKIITALKKDPVYKFIKAQQIGKNN